MFYLYLMIVLHWFYILYFLIVFCNIQMDILSEINIM